jgi:pentatricopeptide repeat protein
MNTRNDKIWVFAIIIAIAVFVAYGPAWNGGWLFDDECHVTKAQFSSLHGLWRIWFEPGSTHEYYPILHSFFWLLYQFLGDSLLGYHLINIFFHVLCAVMIGWILRRCKVPGGYLAAAIFALHPVHVESVAWISEMKNTLSAVFYLAAAIAYLRFDEQLRHCARNDRQSGTLYFLAFGLFVLSLLSKPVTVTLPVALLILMWWEHRSLSWESNIKPLIPFFITGLVVGIVMIFLERHMVGAQGDEFAFTMVERSLIAGRALWFYLGKLLWPGELVFIYPRWEVSEAVWWQYLFPIAALVLLAILWRKHKSWPGLCCGMLFFVVSLFPAMGFLNVYFFVFSFVADHFVYLSSVGVIVVFSAGLVQLLRHYRLWGKPSGQLVCATLLMTLGFLTWQQSRLYSDAETLYTAVLKKNPRCWVAYHNLGIFLEKTDRMDEAIRHFHKAIEMLESVEGSPLATVYNSLANALQNLGRMNEATTYYQKSLEMDPKSGQVHSNLGVVLERNGRTKEAIAHYEKALELDPEYVPTYINLGAAVFDLGRTEEAMMYYQKALEIDPASKTAYLNMAMALGRLGRENEARAYYRKSLEIHPHIGTPDSEGLTVQIKYDETLYNILANILVELGRVDEAIDYFEKAIQIDPKLVGTHLNLGVVLDRVGRVDDALAHYRQALEIDPKCIGAHNNLAVTLDRMGRLEEAIVHYRKALKIDPSFTGGHVNLGMALERRGQMDEALVHYRAALKADPNDLEVLKKLTALEARAKAQPE